MHWLAFILITCLSFNAIGQDQVPAETPSDFPIERMKSQSAKPVQTITDGTTLVLNDGSVMRLDGLRIPGQFSETPSPHHLQAMTKLTETFEGENVRLFYPKALSEAPKHALGHDLGQLVSVKGQIWAQKLILEEGLALAWPSEHSTELYPRLLTFEQSARDNAAGLWQDFEIKTPDTVKPDSFEIQIVEGIVQSVATVSNNIYINFGANWRDDFTIMIPSDLRRNYARKGITPGDWQGRTLRVRGFVEDYNGPMIKIKYPEQIEVKDGP